MTPHEKRVSLYETKEQYLQMKEKWAEMKNHSAQSHVVYNILRGYPVDRGFTPITRQSRIDNGHRTEVDGYLWGLGSNSDWQKSRWESELKTLFGDLITFPTLGKAYEFSRVVEVAGTGQDD